jgi:hypothetical protein
VNDESASVAAAPVDDVYGTMACLLELPGRMEGWRLQFACPQLQHGIFNESEIKSHLIGSDHFE